MWAGAPTLGTWTQKTPRSKKAALHVGQRSAHSSGLFHTDDASSASADILEEVKVNKWLDVQEIQGVCLEEISYREPQRKLPLNSPRPNGYGVTTPYRPYRVERRCDRRRRPSRGAPSLRADLRKAGAG